MNKLLLTCLALLFIISCEKESISELFTDEAVFEENFSPTRSSEKVKICHKGVLIEVDNNALKAHLDHGDEVEFGQIGTYNIIYNFNGSNFIHEMVVTQSENGSFSGTGYSITTGQEWTVEGTIDSEQNYSFTIFYLESDYFATATGTLQCDGSGYNGPWGNDFQSGTWTGSYQSF